MKEITKSSWGPEYNLEGHSGVGLRNLLRAGAPLKRGQRLRYAGWVQLLATQSHTLSSVHSRKHTHTRSFTSIAASW